MDSFIKEIVNAVEPLKDDVYGPLYRCSLTLRDGTFLPCAVLQSRQRLETLAQRRIREELSGKALLAGPDPYGQIVSLFATKGNRVSDYEVASAAESKYAIPLSLLSQIHGETRMGWTGWVFKMTDGKLFSYGSTFSFEFFQLPENYEFADVAEVINHSFVDKTGAVRSLKQSIPDNYSIESVLRERVYFSCAVDGIY